MWPFKTQCKIEPKTVYGPTDINDKRITTDTIQEKEKEKPGLREYFSAGEYLPWKGLLFKIKHVSFDEITIKYAGVTNKTAQRLGEKRR